MQKCSMGLRLYHPGQRTRHLGQRHIAAGEAAKAAAAAPAAAAKGTPGLGAWPCSNVPRMATPSTQTQTSAKLQVRIEMVHA